MGVLSEAGTVYPSRAHGFTPFFLGVCVAHLSVFYVLFLVLLVFVLCLVYSMLPMSLDCPFLIVPSVFSITFICICTNLYFWWPSNVIVFYMNIQLCKNDRNRVFMSLLHHHCISRYLNSIFGKLISFFIFLIKNLIK